METKKTMYIIKLDFYSLNQMVNKYPHSPLHPDKHQLHCESPSSLSPLRLWCQYAIGDFDLGEFLVITTKLACIKAAEPSAVLTETKQISDQQNAVSIDTPDAHRSCLCCLHPTDSG